MKIIKYQIHVVILTRYSFQNNEEKNLQKTFLEFFRKKKSKEIFICFFRKNFTKNFLDFFRKKIFRIFRKKNYRLISRSVGSRSIIFAKMRSK